MQLEEYALRYDYASKMIDRIDASSTSNKNKELIKKFVKYLRALDKKQKTIDKHVYCYEKLLNQLPRNKVLLKMTREEIEDLVNHVNRIEGLNNVTRAKCLVTLKMVFKRFAGEGLYYPPQVAWIKINDKSKNKLTPSDLLTRDEIQRMIKVSISLRDKALISLMADAPLRTHEITKLKRKNLDLTSNPPILIIPEDTKTGTRQIPLIESVPALIAYINGNKDMMPNDFLFLDNVYGGHNHLTDSALRVMVARAAKKAGVQKRVIPYTFRHTRITAYANEGLNNALIEKVAGWKHGTDMFATYEHLSTTDVTTAILKSKGIVQKTEVPKLSVKNCPRCELTNEAGSSFCTRCGSPLNMSIAMEMPKHESNMKEAIAEALKDPNTIEDVVHAYLLMKAKKKGQV